MRHNFQHPYVVNHRPCSSFSGGIVRLKPSRTALSINPGIIYTCTAEKPRKNIGTINVPNGPFILFKHALCKRIYNKPDHLFCIIIVPSRTTKNPVLRLTQDRSLSSISTNKTILFCHIIIARGHLPQLPSLNHHDPVEVPPDRHPLLL